MTTLNSVLLAGLSGLRAAQASIGAASQNITNANTPGYVRTNVVLTPHSDVGVGGGGVDVTAIKRVVDRFLERASFIASASQASATARSDILTRAQETFGDPNSATTMFGMADQFWSALSSITIDPSSALRREDAVDALQATYTEIQRVAQTLQDLTAESDQRIGDAVSEAQDLINRVALLNNEIQQTKANGGDVSAAENTQAALIDQLSGIIDVRVTPLADGGVHVRTGGGALLVGANPATITYDPSDGNFASHGAILLNPQNGSATNLEPMLTGGSLYGLLQARDVDLPGLSEALGGLSGALGDVLNEVHNQNASTPPASQLTGRQTGLLSTDTVNFTGKATIGVVDSDGYLKDRLNIDFDAGTITSDASSTVYSFVGGTVADLTAALNSALGGASPAGAASFSNGVLSLNVSNSGGLVIQQDSADPSDRAGRGFSHYFGLNDLVSSTTPLFFENGLQGSDKLGLNAGGEIDYQIHDKSGRLIGTRAITISGTLAGAGATWDDLLAQLNSTGAGGLGDYGQFSLSSTTGQISFTPFNGFNVSLSADTTKRGATGVSFSQLNGLSAAATAGRALTTNVSQTIGANPSLLAVARPDLTQALGVQVIEGGDNRGAAALAAAKDATRTFRAAGALNAQTTTLGTYAARLGGEAGRIASDAQRAADGAKAVATAASDRRGQVESVNMDDELAKMTTYQNAYAAAARVVQAATQMMDILVNLGVAGASY